MDNPKISVIMPSLNVGPYIKECVDSVLNQSFQDIEIISIDSGSDDGTLEILEKYEDNPQFTLIKSTVKSYGNQVNIGLSKAKGDYISIIETDDYIDKDMFKQLYDLSENGTVDIIKGNFYHFDDSDKNNPKFNKDTNKNFSKYDGNKFILKEYPQFLNGHPSIWSGIYRRKFLEDNKIKFIEAPKGGWVDNPFFFETAICAKSIKFIDKAFYYYRVSNPNSSSNVFSSFTLPMERVLDIFDVFEKYDYKNESVTRLFYNRLFRYIEIILEHNEMNINNLTIEEKEYIQKVLTKVDEKIVKKLIPNFQKLYYKYSSPLLLLNE